MKTFLEKFKGKKILLKIAPEYFAEEELKNMGIPAYLFECILSEVEELPSGIWIEHMGVVPGFSLKEKSFLFIPQQFIKGVIVSEGEIEIIPNETYLKPGLGFRWKREK